MFHSIKEALQYRFEQDVKNKYCEKAQNLHDRLNVYNCSILAVFVSAARGPDCFLAANVSEA